MRLSRAVVLFISTLGRVHVNRLIERCAMLDIHKSQITACVRVPDGDGGRRQEIREFSTTDRRAAHAGGLAAQLRGDRGRDGVHRRLLAGGVLPARGRVRVPAVQRPPSSSRPRPQERCAGCRVGLSAARARARRRELRAAPAAARAARPGPLPQGQDPGAHAARSSGSRRPSRTRGSSSPRSPPRCSACPPARCSTR